MNAWRSITYRLASPAARATAAALLLIAAAAAGYRIGDSEGQDPHAAQLAGLVAGEEQGAAQGARRGYARGFRSARKRVLEVAYRDAYLAACRDEFERAGLAVPEAVAVRGP